MKRTGKIFSFDSFYSYRAVGHYSNVKTIVEMPPIFCMSAKGKLTVADAVPLQESVLGLFHISFAVQPVGTLMFILFKLTADITIDLIFPTEEVNVIVPLPS